MDFSQQTKNRINLYIGRAQRRIMYLGRCNAKLVLDNNEYEDYAKNISIINDLRDSINYLQRIGLIWTENETNIIIDYYMSEYNLDIRSFSILEPKQIIAPVELNPKYATKIELNTEEANRINQYNALNVAIVNLQEALSGLDFDDDLGVVLVNYALKSELHEHSNKTVLDQLTQTLLDEIKKVSPHINDNIRHITQAEREYWNAKIGADDPALGDTRPPTAHNHNISDIIGLTDALNEIINDLANTSGEDGKSPVISIGTVSEGDNSEASIDNTDPLNPKLNLTLVRGKDFKPDYSDIAVNRFDSSFDIDEEGDGLFTYLATDTGYLYFRNYTFPATQPQGWSSGLQFLGDSGWSPLLGLHTVSSVIEVLEIIDWVGGEGEKPTFPNPPDVSNPRWFIGINGVTTFPEHAKNLKGTPGPKGDNGIFTIDEVGINLAARTQYDEKSFGFVFLDDQTGKLYIKESDSTSDWSVGYQWRGFDGQDGSGGNGGSGGSEIVIDRADGGTSKNIKDFDNYSIIDSESIWIIDGGNAGSLTGDYDILDGGESDGNKASGTGVSGSDGDDGEDGDKFATTSTTSVLIGTGTKNLTVEAGLAYTKAQAVIIAESNSNYMEGRVISYNSITGAISVDVTDVTGSGTYTSWDVNLAGASGVDGTLLKGDSTSTITAATGSKTFTLTSGLNYGFIVGHYMLAQANDVSTVLRGIITSVADNVVSVLIDDVIGSETSSDWTFAVAGGKGDPGGKGDAGEKGDDGNSAYEVWLENGNVGTISDFLDSLKGDDGDSGADGTTTIAQSSSTLTFSTGTKTVTLSEFNVVFGDNFGFGIGQRVSIAFSSTIYMTGNVTNYNIGTKVLSVNVDTLVGSTSNQSSWTVTLIGEKGSTGDTGTKGDDGLDSKISSTSTSTHSASTGNKVFNLPTGFNYGFIPNQRIIVDSSSNGTILRGYVVSYSNFVLTVNIDEVTTNSGSSSSWNIGIEAPKIIGADGAPGDDGFIYHAVSTTNNNPQLGSKNFTLPSGPNYGFAVDQLITVKSDNGIILYGSVTGLSNNILSVNVQLVTNPFQSSSSSSWSVQLSAVPFLLEGITTNQFSSGAIEVGGNILFILQPNIIFGFKLNDKVLITHPNPSIITNKYTGIITNITGNSFTINITGAENIVVTGGSTWLISLDNVGKDGQDGSDGENFLDKSRATFFHPAETSINITVNSTSTGTNDIPIGYTGVPGTVATNTIYNNSDQTTNYIIIIDIQVEIPQGTSLILAFEIIRNGAASDEKVVEYRVFNSNTNTAYMMSHAFLNPNDGVRARVFRNGTGQPILKRREIAIMQAPV